MCRGNNARQLVIVNEAKRLMKDNLVQSVIQRQGWLDWMKVLGMLFIVWGHSGTKLFSDFIYTFNVPLFFIVSGYLSRCKYEKNVIGWGKIVRLLIIPYLCLSAINIIFNVTLAFAKGALTLKYFTDSLFSCLAGHECGPLWFVYTLALIKIICLYVDKALVYVLSLVGLIWAIYLHSIGYQDFWAVTNTLVSLPFFSLGFFLSRYKRNVNKTKNCLKNVKPAIFTLIMLGLVCCTYFISIESGYVKMFRCGYGNNPLLFLIGGTVGTLLIAIVSMKMDDKWSIFTTIVAKGNIVILALHFHIIRIGSKIVDLVIQNPLVRDLVALSLSGLIIICFVPIILFIQKHIPIVVGKR